MPGYIRPPWFLPAGLLCVFALLQLDDPDAALWVAAYLLPASLCLVRGLGLGFPRACLAIGLGYGVLACVLWPFGETGFSGAMDPAVPGIERARESLGLGICALVLLALARANGDRPAG